MSKKDDASSDARNAEATRRGGRDKTSLRNPRGDADIEFVEALAKLLRDNDLAEIEVVREYGEDDELTVRLSRYPHSVAMAPAPAAPTLSLPQPAAASAPAPAEAAAPSDPTADPGCVTSPMVGTVYLAPEPGAANFVQVGDSVETGQTLLIVEAMKTMNQIPSPKGGKVKEILVSNGQPVEYGAPLLVLE